MDNHYNVEIEEEYIKFSYKEFPLLEKVFYEKDSREINYIDSEFYDKKNLIIYSKLLKYLDDIEIIWKTKDIDKIKEIKTEYIEKDKKILFKTKINENEIAGSLMKYKGKLKLINLVIILEEKMFFLNEYYYKNLEILIKKFILRKSKLRTKLLLDPDYSKNIEKYIGVNDIVHLEYDKLEILKGEVIDLYYEKDEEYAFVKLNNGRKAKFKTKSLIKKE